MKAPVIVLALALLAGGCVTPRAQDPGPAAKPGWGRGFSAEERTTTVRAVPAAATPSPPPTSLGKPGWGRLER